MDKIFEITLPTLPTPVDYEQVGKGQEQLVLAAVGAMARATWIELASRKFPNNGKRYMNYVNAIQQPEILPGMVTIALVGQAAHDIEFGKPAYDLRDVLLNSKVPVKKRGQSGKGKYESSKGGYYRPIPFRHSNPDSAGVVGPAVGSAHAHQMGTARAHEMGAWIWKAAKDLRASTEKPNQKIKWGERLATGMAPKLKEHHKTDIYASMVRIQKTYGKATQSKMMTFRTISTRVRTGWIVPAKAGEYIMAEVKGHMKVKAPAYVASIINAPSKGGTAPEMPSP